MPIDTELNGNSMKEKTKQWSVRKADVAMTVVCQLRVKARLQFLPKRTSNPRASSNFEEKKVIQNVLLSQLHLFVEIEECGPTSFFIVLSNNVLSVEK